MTPERLLFLVNKYFTEDITVAKLEYKGHPLQRKDKMIYYGSFADKYIIMMQILEAKKVKDLDVASKISVQLQQTDPSVKSRDRIVKKSEKDSFYTAMDVAAVWLERALNQT